MLRCSDCQKKTDLHPACGADHVEPPFDVHSAAAKHLFGLEGEPTREQRNAGKNALYMALYSNPYRTSGPPNYDYVQAETRILASMNAQGLDGYGRKINRRKWYHADWILQIWDFFGGPRMLRWCTGRHRKIVITPIPTPDTFQSHREFVDECRRKIATAISVPPLQPHPPRDVRTAQKMLEEKK
jgi:hypothetical protein